MELENNLCNGEPSLKRMLNGLVITSLFVRFKYFEILSDLKSISEFKFCTLVMMGKAAEKSQKGMMSYSKYTRTELGSKIDPTIVGIDRGVSVIDTTGSQVVKIGRPDDIVFEPTRLIIKRAYGVRWKKTITNPEELAKLYWVQGLSQAEIARQCKVRRSTISGAVKKFRPVG